MVCSHHELLDLGRDGHREFGHELDIARNLVMGNLALAELADLLGRGALAGLQLDPGADQSHASACRGAANPFVILQAATRTGPIQVVATGILRRAGP
jgi:hypothetical protein